MCAPVQPATGPKHRVLFNRFRVPEIALFVADADGKNERALPHRESEYSPSLTPDGKWIVFTSERAGQSDLYRMHPDGSGLEQLTDDPAFDDQGALSPDGKSLAFISTRGEGFANLWLLDIASRKYRNLTKSRSGNFRPSWSPGRPLDRLQFRSRCQSRKVPRAVGAPAVHRHLSDSPGRYRIAPFDQGRRRCRQPDLVLRRQSACSITRPMKPAPISPSPATRGPSSSRSTSPPENARSTPHRTK